MTNYMRHVFNRTVRRMLRLHLSHILGCSLKAAALDKRVENQVVGAAERVGNGSVSQRDRGCVSLRSDHHGRVLYTETAQGGRGQESASILWSKFHMDGNGEGSILYRQSFGSERMARGVLEVDLRRSAHVIRWLSLASRLSHIEQIRNKSVKARRTTRTWQ
ncbi:hypothetical protein VTK73DRAFT_9374 [Phialemonium thermophilum]|uniref:Uncharacterized protein n=1 Tax=Phialemonium thermophilum TaxID=223376 RepID=A0ABR3W2S5_9PEZI